ncbi:thioredoxin domain-containing protein [Flavobacterium salilacus subsp. salilacus]|uniref:thioredoxin domain-containing protein n=1 Tax=Flavobacterium TaxID=237 RepID=UPI001075745C|nr:MULTISPECIES: thioredoxin domain-containing protein [Flavobacterium]KAF2519988.1 thioredoxin domain-containing protein [Flavobacterium salilacus subsp. salilacus]MBE1614098.1 thioredoxin domain-containing protein [Flavobacterium sp. SaA2.13]
MNELKQETSPYLLQHANNPIYWKAWNENTLATARRENKLMVLSVGYSACHWCHVMEHESFEDEEVAQVMNDHYIAIKVDREERPDVDAIYMKAVQLMTRQGGWPMNVVLLPDGRPVWGGTYFRKDAWISALQQLQQLYTTDPAKMEEYAEKLHSGVAAMNLTAGESEGALPEPGNMKPIVEKWATSFDDEYGGYARAPKFMMPNNYLFLQRYGYQTNNTELLNHVDLTLTRMAWGGLFDTVGGGFSRYSVDMKWHIPHFEKMLYDNGQLMSLYAEAYKRTKNVLYKEVIEKTHAFVAKELTMDNGAFYSALDADSLDDKGNLEEGAFYVWEKEELKSLLGNDLELFAVVYNVNEFGFWEDGKFVLIQNKPLEELAHTAGSTPEALHQKKQEWESLLYEVREKREKPRLDDKVLTSWNALMLKGYVDAYKALGDKVYLDAALKNAEFITNTMWHENGHLWRTYKNGEAKIAGFLEDYALTADAFIALHQATMDEKWLLYAKQLTDYCLDNFYDEKQQFFSFNAANGEQLIAPHFETEDNVIPASNSVMGNVLYTLSILFNNNYYEEVALQMLYNIIPSLDYPSAFSNWLNLWLSLSSENRELAVCGINAEKAVKAINSEYMPHVIMAGCKAKSEIPFLSNRFVKDGLMFYVCRNKICNLPTSSVNEVLHSLKMFNS